MRSELVQGHAYRNVRVLDHLFELIEADLAVAVLIGLHDGLVDNLRGISESLHVLIDSTHLLQLLVLQIAPNHHLQYYEELAVADVTVAVDVVDAKGKP